MNKAVIYARYSSDNQREESIEAQLRACNEYALNHGYSVIGTYEDKAKSGRSDHRPEFQRMIRDSQKDLFDAVLIHKYNRFARRMTDHVKYEDKLNNAGVDLIAVAEDFGKGKEAIIMKSLMRALSEYYSIDLADETRKGHKETALQGKHNGGVPLFGYDVVDQKYIINEIEAAFVRRIFDCAINRKGFTDIINEMDKKGIKGKLGKSIKYTQIYEMLRNEKYTGTYIYCPNIGNTRAKRRTKPEAIKVENALPIIISKARFEEVQQIMNDRKQTGRKSNYLCSGLVYCVCGAKMHGSAPSKNGYKYKIYSCSKKCGFGTVSMDEIDNAAVKYLKDLLSSKNQDRITKALRLYQAGEKDRVQDFNTALKRDITAKKRQYDAYLDNLSKGELPREVVADIGQKMKEIKSEIAELEQTKPPVDFTPDQINVWLDSLKNTPDEKAIHLLIERIDIKTKTEYNITSTLKSVLGENGRDDTQHILPKILFEYQYRK